MKKVIKGKTYDTKTAKAIASAVGGTWGDPRGWSETLYRKRTGEYFLHGSGGSESSYAEGEAIRPLTWDEAAEWARKNLDEEDSAAMFGKKAY